MPTRRAIVAAAAALALPGLASAAPAPAFSGVDLDGKTRSLAEFKGKTVVLEWVNEGCPYVRKHYGAGSMQATQAAARADDVVWIQIVSSAPGEQGYFSSPAKAKAWIAAQKAQPSLMLLDPQGQIGRLYKATATPGMFVIDKAGELVYRGAIDDKASTRVEDLKTAKNYVRAALSDLKAGRTVQAPFSRPYGCAIKYT